MINLFSKGVIVEEEKDTSSKSISTFPIPKQVVIPLLQHIGKPCTPLVKIGDKVLLGQKIADAEGCAAPIHATVSGTVEEIKKADTAIHKDIDCIIIKSDGKDSWNKMKPLDLESSKEELISRIKEAGIAGLGGAMFPTHIKYCSDKKVDTIIANGCECEPYLTTDHRLMLEHTKEIIKGLAVLKKISGAKEVVIAIESNKKGAIEQMKKAAKGMKVVKLPTIYPQGAEKWLIKNITKKEIPPLGLPIDVGVVVNNVGTAKAIHDAVFEGKPLIERVVTVAGEFHNTGNFVVRIGTPIKHLVDFCKPKKDARIVYGGPMMGFHLDNADVPVIKGCSGIIALKAEQPEEKSCIRCSRCVKSCPLNLLPNTLAKLAQKGLYKATEDYNICDCIECGCCAYVCPSKINHIKHIRKAKEELKKCPAVE